MGADPYPWFSNDEIAEAVVARSVGPGFSFITRKIAVRVSNAATGSRVGRSRLAVAIVLNISDPTNCLCPILLPVHHGMGPFRSGHTLNF